MAGLVRNRCLLFVPPKSPGPPRGSSARFKGRSVCRPLLSARCWGQAQQVFYGPAGCYQVLAANASVSENTLGQVLMGRRDAVEGSAEPERARCVSLAPAQTAATGMRSHFLPTGPRFTREELPLPHSCQMAELGLEPGSAGPRSWALSAEAPLNTVE